MYENEQLAAVPQVQGRRFSSFLFTRFIDFCSAQSRERRPKLVEKNKRVSRVADLHISRVTGRTRPERGARAAISENSFVSFGLIFCKRKWYHRTNEGS
jgi:hypothetical protein